jgi:uncharacterized cupin superfamily protein
MTNNTAIIRIPYVHSKQGEYTPENIVKGKPSAMVNNLYTDPSGCFSTGVWASSQGKWSFEQKESEEFCYIIEGKASLVDEKNHTTTSVQKGDAFVIPIGFKGTWETNEPLKKFYAVFERNKIPSKL